MTPTIFVQVAAYLDRDLPATVRSALGEADDPSRLRFGICHQFDDDTADQLADVAGDPRFRVDPVRHTRSEGVGWARARANALYDGEDHVLQIDAHTRFVDGWDTILVDMLSMVPSPRPLLTIYPPPYEVAEDGTERRHTPYPHPRRMGLRHMGSDGVTRQLMEEVVGASVPGRQVLVAAGFLFAPGRFVRDVPYDPEWYFGGEEIALALRAYTHGYDSHFPTRHVAWHRYGHGWPLHWESHPRPQVERLSRRSLGALARLVNGDTRRPFGLGTHRTVAGFEAALGHRFPPLTDPSA